MNLAYDIKPDLRPCIRVELSYYYKGDKLFSNPEAEESQRNVIAIYRKPMQFFILYIHPDNFSSKRLVYMVEGDAEKDENWHVKLANFITANIVLAYPANAQHEVLYGYCKEELQKLDASRFHNKKLRLSNNIRIILLNNVKYVIDSFKLKNGFNDQHNRHIVES